MKLKIPTTPVPDFLFDELLPILGDTEFRLLCLVVRKTLGFTDPKTKQLKSRDWLSSRQLKATLRRSSATISRAIDRLCRAQLLIVEDSQGRELLTPPARRRHQGRLYFRLSDLILTGAYPVENLPTEIQKLKTTINNEDNKHIVVSKNQKARSALKSKDRTSRRIQSEWQRVGEELKVRRCAYLRRKGHHE